MRTRYILESYEDYRHAASNVRQEGDTLPIITGTLEARRLHDESDRHTVELIGDPNFEFGVPFKQFVLGMCKELGVPLKAQDFIPQ